MPRCGFFSAALGCVFVAGVAAAQPVVEALHDGPVQITIRPDGAIVRESLRAEFSGVEALVRMPQIPGGADLSTLVLRDRRREMRLLDWWQASGTAGGWMAHMQTAGPGRKSFDVVYRMTGLTWRAHYDVLVRGALADVTNAVSMDIEGWIEVENRTAREFREVQLTVIGPDTLGRIDPGKAPGFLDLDEDNPMSDVWRYQPLPAAMPHRYEVGRGFTLPAGRTTMLPYLQVARGAVERRWLIRAEQIPTDGRQRGAAPTLFLAFENARDLAGGRATPPGTASIHLGNRNTLFQKAWFKHTPARSEIMIDTGAVPGLHVRRVTRDKVDRVDGGYEQVYELRVESTLDQPVPLIIDETPPSGRSWTLLRATEPYDMRDRRIIFTPSVKPRAETVFNYTLRVM